MTRSEPCCVEGCTNAATHEREFTIAADGWGDVGTVAVFCCEHIDRLAAQDAPFLDLKIAGRIRP